MAATPPTAPRRFPIRLGLGRGTVLLGSALFIACAAASFDDRGQDARACLAEPVGYMVAFLEEDAPPLSVRLTGTVLAFSSGPSPDAYRYVIRDVAGAERRLAYRASGGPLPIKEGASYDFQVDYVGGAPAASGLLIRDGSGLVFAGATDQRLGAHVLKDGLPDLVLALLPGACRSRSAPPLRLSTPALTVGIVPGLGGRIVELRTSGGENLLDADPRLWKEPFPPADLRTPFQPWNGHTYWVGPQSAWWTQQEVDAERRRAKATWPPDPFHETARYEVRESSRSRARLESPPSPITGLRRQLEVALVGARRVRIGVTATNDRAAPVAWSFYSNTRVRPDGWAYVRLAPGGIKRIDSPGGASAAYPHRVVRGFFVSPPGVSPASPADTPRTADAFLRPVEAQIAYFRGHQLLLKRAPSFSEARLHPEETLVEIYRSSGGARDAELLELELHGPYETLAPGQTMSFEETWEILRYPGPPEPESHLDFLDRLGPTRRTDEGGGPCGRTPNGARRPRTCARISGAAATRSSSPAP